MEAIIFVDKPSGMSSFGAVARVRRILSQQEGHKVKVGHTGTLDPFATGLLILLAGKATKKAPELTKKDKIEQRPPAFSAIKINGQRAYKLARAGKDFEIPTRTVEIYELEMLSYDEPELKIRTHVSSGTYIRTLAEDIGKALGCGAYCSALRRTKIADYDIAKLPLFELPD